MHSRRTVICQSLHSNELSKLIRLLQNECQTAKGRLYSGSHYSDSNLISSPEFSFIALRTVTIQILFNTHYGDQEVYFDHWIDTQYVDQYEGRLVPGGCHRIPFAFRLPDHVPSSYEGLYGHVRYDCTAVLSRAWKLDLVCRKAFRVVAAEDLNTIPDIGRPLKFRETQEIFCCCFRRGSLGLDVHLPKRGYVPGELLDASCEIVNNSTKTVDLVIVTLKQHVSFRGKTALLSHAGVKQVSKDVTQLEWTTAIAPGAANRFNFQFVVPAVPPRMLSCGIIDIHYLLKIRVGAWLHCDIPILIGTVPVDMGPVSNQQNLLPSVFGPYSDQLLSAYESPPPYRDETPPPPYEICLLVRNSAEFNESNLQQTTSAVSPSYPMLSCDQSFQALRKNYYTLTMTWRKDSDIYSPFELQKYIDIDIYGYCGSKKCKKTDQAYQEYDPCEMMFRKEYKFYIAFENTVCTDWVTEKTFNRINMHSVPIVLSRKIYSKIAPNMSFIAADDFKSPADLAQYLKYLHSNTDKYIQYFKWKTKFDSVPFPNGFHLAFCQLCKRIKKENEDGKFIISPKATDLKRWFIDKMIASQKELAVSTTKCQHPHIYQILTLLQIRSLLAIEKFQFLLPHVFFQ
ncbi:Glycoprotein 3-alpha-L-fucosyltransferase A [Trichinella nativa]|uniref:Fucosyltransferase n=1 Tax=Trichinella nativa TaxID=6335 RepID=A0A0V1L0F9_9BILA|nr:Glycoprotein 3-alpha-L-fucosyltransferase A [Trichinella nativa]